MATQLWFDDFNSGAALSADYEWATGTAKIAGQGEDGSQCVYRSSGTTPALGRNLGSDVDGPGYVTWKEKTTGTAAYWSHMMVAWIGPMGSLGSWLFDLYRRHDGASHVGRLYIYDRSNNLKYEANNFWPTDGQWHDFRVEWKPSTWNGAGYDSDGFIKIAIDDTYELTLTGQSWINANGDATQSFRGAALMPFDYVDDFRIFSGLYEVGGGVPGTGIEYHDGTDWVEITDDVVREASVTIQRGMGGGLPTDRVAMTGTCAFALRNDADNSQATLGLYSPDHASVRTGWRLGAPLRVTFTDPSDDTAYLSFLGRVDEIAPVPGVKGSRLVRVVGVDWMDEAARWYLTGITEQVNQRADAILTSILSVMPTPPEATDLDTGRDSFPYALDLRDESRTSALEEFGRLAASEMGYLYLTRDGTLRLENRLARLLLADISGAFTDDDLSGLELAGTRDEIVNEVKVTAWPRLVDSAATTLLYEQQNPIAIAPTETRTLLGPYRDPNTGDQCGGVDMVAPVAGVHWSVNTQQDGGGSDLTGSCSLATNYGPAGVRYQVTNNSASAGYITMLRAIGRGVYARNSVTASAGDATSKTTYGERTLQLDMPYQPSVDVAQAAANWLLDAYKSPAARVRAITIYGSSAERITHCITRDISDRITVTETVTGLDAAQCFIQGVRLTLMPTGHLRATWTLMPAPAAQDYWILGTTVLGSNSCVPAPF